MNGQTISFGFRKLDPDSRGEEFLKSFAKGMTLLPEYALRIEGHSNLAKSEKKLTAEDKARIQKLSEDRADSCARFLKSAGVQNEITCVGQGPLKGETKGCVRLVLLQKWTPQQLVQPDEVDPSHIAEGEANLLKKEPDVVDGAVADNSAPKATAEEDFIMIAQGTDDQVLPERSSAEGTSPSDPEETDGPITLETSAGFDVKISEPAQVETDPSKEEVGSKLNPDGKLTSSEVVPPASSAPAEADQWGNTYLPWYITCCSQKARPKTDECPMQGLPVKQMQLLQ